MLAGGLMLSTLDTQLPDILSVEMTIFEERACFSKGRLTTGRDLHGGEYTFGKVEWDPSGYTVAAGSGSFLGKEGDR